MIPKKFKIAGFEISVSLEDSLPDNNYGSFNDATNTIKVARSVKNDGEVIWLTEDQILNTFIHECIHCFQFYFNNSYDEAQAQTYANFICEYLKSKER